VVKYTILKMFIARFIFPWPERKKKYLRIEFKAVYYYVNRPYWIYVGKSRDRGVWNEPCKPCHLNFEPVFQPKS